ncbi:serine hydrolase domain-containing protein [Bradyrhizobium erythrophlei]|uniref:serine hydrolase domain-containing protein n=1 Tax=Bradyrhizobium erythrophlei TaxID=1437360 RepID=UPI0035EFB889
MGARLDGVIARSIAERRIVGTVVLVAHGNDVIYRRAAGLADREAGTPMREDAIFRLASITKSYVTAAAMRLVEVGCMALDDQVTRFLPEFRPRLADGRAPPITLAQLLTHTSGLSYRFLEQPGSAYHALDISDGLDQPGLSFEDALRRIAAAPLVFVPGERWNYSVGIDVIGAVVERVMQRPLPEIVAKLVTTPLGMAETAFHVADPSRLVKPYADGTPTPQPITDGMEVPRLQGALRFAPSRILDASSYPSGGAGMAGTADDTLRFLLAIHDGGTQILKASTVVDMMSDHAGFPVNLRDPGWGFGYGWAVLTDARKSGSPQSNGTIGWGGAYGHNWFIDPARKLTVVILTNTTFEGVSGAFPAEIRNAIYGDGGTSRY